MIGIKSGLAAGARGGGEDGVRSLALLRVAEMGRADATAIGGGVAGAQLMEGAGAAVAAEVMRRWAPAPTVVLCGPGKNGGDGFVAARHLAAAGWPVTVALLGARDRLRGDAAHHAAHWRGMVVPLTPEALADATIVIDAVFGAGLARPLEGPALATIEAIGARGLACLAVDVPSGVDGDSGAVRGAAPMADATVTFFRRKPGHLLLPGRLHCGAVVVADIGIPDSVLDDIAPATFSNGPALWRRRFPWPRLEGHKYSRGHAVIAGGAMTGAARLAARGALRAGAGLVSVACMAATHAIYASDRPGVIVREADDAGAYAALVGDRRVTASLLGPGLGVGAATRDRVLAALETGKPCVLDADALTSFADDRATLFDAIRGPCVMTPHEGEFARLFDAGGDKLTRARVAAAKAGAVVLLKGADTVIAEPGGRAAINDNAPAALATAGAGDVLAGFVVALLAQGMPAFEAAGAAVWLHGDAARRFGPGLIAEDLPEMLPHVLLALAG